MNLRINTKFKGNLRLKYTPKVRQTFGGAFFMAKKGQVLKKYSPEFKLSVILDMRENKLSYNNERISHKLKGMSPVQYRTHSQTI